jgi:hypothetical protein
MNSKEDLIQLYKGLLSNLTYEEIEDFADRMWIKQSTVKHGKNVIHLQYYGEIIADNDIYELDQLLALSGLELSHYDMNGVPTASLRDFTLEVFLVINNPVIQDVLVGLLSSVLWDSIKASTLLVWNRMKNNHWSSPRIKEKSEGLQFGVKVQLDNSTTVDFKLEGDVSQELIEASLEKMLSVVNAIQKNNIKERQIFCTYNEQTQSWDAVDSMEQLIKANQQRNSEINGD